MLRLINDVLDLAQIEAGKLFLSTEPVQAARLVEESFNYCQSMAKEKNITLRFDDATLRSCFIYVDQVRLRQCLLNLISNAIKYNVYGGQVDVVFMQRGKELEISINDTGPGIPESKQASLFEMFNRLGAERSSIEGSGLGLVLTKQLVTAMGGELKYCDQSAPGSSFKMCFSIVDAPSILTSPNIEQKEESAKGVDIHFVEHKKIYYIEDNISNIRLMESLIEPCSQLSLSSQVDPFLGLFDIRTQIPDLVLLDINLPGISGYDLLNVLKQDPLTSHLPVVALSASAMAKDVERGLEEGFDAYLTKPLNVERLSEAFNRLLSPSLID